MTLSYYFSGFENSEFYFKCDNCGDYYNIKSKKNLIPNDNFTVFIKDLFLN